MTSSLSDQLSAAFVRASVLKLRQDARQIARCVALLDERELWSRANEHCNSVANLLLHLDGNVRQWIVGGVAGRAVTRRRQAEFDARGGATADSLLQALGATIDETISVIEALSAADLAEPRRIQDYEVTVLQAVYHVVEHFSWHAGQIVHMTKALRDVDLSLYDSRGFRAGAPGGLPWTD